MSAAPSIGSGIDHPIQTSLFADSWDIVPKPFAESWTDLVDRLTWFAKTTAHPCPAAANLDWLAQNGTVYKREKEKLPAFAGTLFAPSVHHKHGPGVWRSNESAVGVTLVCLDFDDVMLAQFGRVWRRLDTLGLAALSVPSTRPAAPGLVRMRVVVPLSRAVAEVEFKARFWRAAADHICEGEALPGIESVNKLGLFYVPTKRPDGTPNVVTVLRGAALDVDAILALAHRQ